VIEPVWDLVRRALDEKGWGNLYNGEDLHREICNAKNALLTPEEARGWRCRRSTA
jgi:hypothetical protein